MGRVTYPTCEEIAEIVGEADPVLRNDLITWSYHRLDRAMEGITGTADVSWCAFATWASKTAGVFIREDVREIIEGFLERVRHLVDQAVPHVRRLSPTAQPADQASLPPAEHLSLGLLADGVLRHVATAIAGGNRAVFADIAPRFSRLLEGRRDVPPAPAEFASTADRAEGSEPDGESSSMLRRGFAAYVEGATTPDPHERAQRVLDANARIGYAEQALVQPYIVTSMRPPWAELLVGHATRAHAHEALPLRLLHTVEEDVRRALRPLVADLDAAFRHFCTHELMQIELPDGALPLGRPVPPLPWGEMYPPPLQTLDDPDLVDLFARLGATDAARSAADDWSDFSQRMRFIGVLFRSRQQDLALRAPPLTPAQRAELARTSPRVARLLGEPPRVEPSPVR